MDTDNDIFDLGDADRLQLPGEPVPQELPELPRPAIKNPRPPQRPETTAAAGVHTDPDWTAVPSLVIPGAAHMLRGEVAKAFCLLSLTGFTLTLAWAIHNSLDRLGPTLEILEMPRAGGVWALGLLGVLLGCLHVVGVYGGAQSNTGESRTHQVYPVVSGVASGIIPGLGQLLNGDRGRAVFLLCGLWLVAASWMLVSPWTNELMSAQNLVLPLWLKLAASPVVRWTLPAVLWTLSVYDAAARASSRRFTD